MNLKLKSKWRIFAEKTDKFIWASAFLLTAALPITAVENLNTTGQAIASVQQTIKITGYVTDASGGGGGDPLIGASVVEKGTTNGIITDVNGNFSITVSSGATLVVSYLGYQPKEVIVEAGKTHYEITLSEDLQALNEVVVVGYGVQKKRDLTGAISSVKMSDEPVGTFSTISHALAGKAAGLNVSQTSAQVGGNTKFRIRGETSINAGNDPLIIIDGFPVTSNPSPGSGNRYSSGSTDNLLESINPDDIESIEVLKDASSTAIYGARAGHGVIIITTKRGKVGKSKVTYSGNYSVQNMKNPYKMLNAQDFMDRRNKDQYENWMKNNGQGIYGQYITPNANPAPFVAPYTEAEIAAAKTTDWFGAVTRTGQQQTHNVSLTGGNEATQYLVSLNYFAQEGVIKTNELERYTTNVNLDHQVSKYVKTGISLNLSRNDYNSVALGDSDWENAGVIPAAVHSVPYIPVRDENGEYTTNPYMGQLPNAASLLEITDRTTKDRLLGSVYLELKPINDLTIRGSLGADRKYAKRRQYVPTSTMYGARVNGQATIVQDDKLDLLMDLTATYVKEIGDHSLTALVGYSYQEMSSEWVRAGNDNFPLDGFLYNNLGAGNNAKPDVGSSASRSSMSSYFARVNYSYLDRYLLTATLRADGASNFMPKERWGYFPSASVGWRFTDEAFLEGTKTILSNGKLRAGYGETGNSNVGLRIYDTYGVSGEYVFGDSKYVGMGATKLGNPKLTWETTKEFNVGLDLGFLNNRINLTAEYYNRVISDLLQTSVPLPFYNEITTIADNVGETQGKGIELTLNTINVNRNDWFWSTDLTYAHNEDRWKTRRDDWTPAVYESATDYIRSIYVYKTDGLMQPGETRPAWQPALLPGQIKIQNLADAEGAADKMDQYDRVLLGSRDPDFVFGFNNTVRYKQFDFNIYFYGEVGAWKGRSYYEQWANGFVDANIVNKSEASKYVWSHDNQNTTYPSAIPSTYASYENSSDYWYRKISFVRCRNITLGYTVPVKNGLSNLRIYADVNNPFVITNWNGIDPETDNFDSSRNNAGAFNYPNVTSYSLGLNITF
ncbi:MAG: TonB-dependent receptor [Tannerella sp.]|jgi:TonB-linked SusC/RagA family outer membrane protein|nr:TonB-dependent receptor [Tannerella sp.]